MRYPKHAKERMVARNISAKIVEDVFKWPHSTVPTRNGCTNFKTSNGFKYRLTVAADGTLVTVWKESLA